MLKTGQPTILLADANIETLDRNAALLLEMGLFNHLHAENGSEALAMIKNFRPDVLILSHELPDIPGLTVLSKVRQMEPGNQSAVVVIYGEKVDDRLYAKAGRMGVDNLLVCPYDADTFKKKIHRTIYEEIDVKAEQAEALEKECKELMVGGKLDEALDKCNQILELNDNAEVYYNLGYILSVRGKLEEALENFRKATLINGQHAGAYQQMGLIHQRLGNADEAQRCLEYAAELHMVLNQESEAEEIINTVLALRPNTTNVYNTLGIIYRHQGRLQESVKAYEKAMRVHPEDENILFNIARVYLDLNDIPMAQGCLRKATALNSNFTAARDLLRATELGLKIKV
ncbi:MAG: tetratricopeptide repeat protein [Deltaproteobacteria bacterium]|jgi:tetratricopeptide (TPR) repeat protein|nr:tetratricopeptide repeat protein [Deltaproteobacteria bacterium]